MATNYYKKKNPTTGVDDFREVGTDRYIGPTEYGNGANFTEQAKTSPRAPQRSTVSSSPLDQYKTNQTVVDLIKEGIKRKQGANKDIQSSRNYWRTQQRNPMTFTDEKLRLLSPSQQRSLRETRYATAGANLAGLRDEEKYRETRMEDILGGVRDVQNAGLADRDYQLRLKQEARLQNNANISNFKSLRGSGYIVDDKGNMVRDYSTATAEQIAMAMKGVESGGDYNIKGTSNETGAYQYTPGTWSQYSQEYNAAVNQMSGELPMTPENQDAVTIYKVQKWIDKGYQPQQIVSMWNAGEGKPDAYKENWRGTNDYGVQYDTPAHVGKVMGSLGRIMGAPAEEMGHVTWSEAAARGLAEKSGIDSTKLWNEYSDAELDALAREQGTSLVDETAEKLSERELVAIGITDKNVLKEILTLMYELNAPTETIEALMREVGLQTETKDGENVLEELQSLILE